MSLLAFNMNHHLHCIYLFLFFLGCLAPDPGQNISTTSISSTQKHAPQTRAPLKIDPAILQNRTFNEAPMFSQQVNQGKLPPVSDRLPEIPSSSCPLKKLAPYGGTLRRALTGDIVQTPDPTKPSTKTSWAMNAPFQTASNTTYASTSLMRTVAKSQFSKIRKGVKWSDGYPFTVDDILFWYYDMTFDDDARQTPFPQRGWMVDGKPMAAQKNRLSHPRNLITQTPGTRTPRTQPRSNRRAKTRPVSPAPKYIPKPIKTFRKPTTSAQLLMQPGIPRISAWIPVEWIRGQRIIYERNPYYWKIDTAGNQPPLCRPHHLQHHPGPPGNPAKIHQRRTRPDRTLYPHRHVPHPQSKRENREIQSPNHRTQQRPCLPPQLGRAQPRLARSFSQQKRPHRALTRCEPRRN